MAQQFNINVDLSTLPKRKCHCGSETFIPAINLYEVPAILSPNGKAGIVATDAGFVCLACQAPANLEPSAADERKRAGLICLDGGGQA